MRNSNKIEQSQKEKFFKNHRKYDSPDTSISNIVKHHSRCFLVPYSDGSGHRWKQVIFQKWDYDLYVHFGKSIK